jgi:hypothetical protein
LVNNDLDRRDAILEASEFLADILSYYAIIDQNYRNRKVESDERLEEALVKIYTAILAYTAEVDRAHQESGGGTHVYAVAATHYSNGQSTARIVKSISALAGPALERLKDDIKLESDNVKTRKDLTVHLGMSSSFMATTFF